MSGLFSGGKTETKLESTLTPQQKRVQAKLGTYLLPQIGQGLPGYPGKLSAELPSEYQKSEQYLQDVMSGKFASSDYLEPYYKTNIQDPLMETWKRTILPEIGGEAGRGGYFYGSGRETLERESGEKLLETLGTERSKLYFQTEQAERARQQEAAGMSLSAAMGETAVEQGILTREQEEWLRTQPEYNQMLSLVMGYLGQNYMTPTTTITGPGFLSSLITGAASGFATGLGGNPKLFG